MFTLSFFPALIILYLTQIFYFIDLIQLDKHQKKLFTYLSLGLNTATLIGFISSQHVLDGDKVIQILPIVSLTVSALLIFVFLILILINFRKVILNNITCRKIQNTDRLILNNSDRVVITLTSAFFALNSIITLINFNSKIWVILLTFVLYFCESVIIFVLRSKSRYGFYLAFVFSIIIFLAATILTR